MCIFNPIKFHMKKTSLFTSLWLSLLLCHAAAAETIKVRTLAELQTAINTASPGDVIELAAGVYTTTEDILVSRAGTADKPITISAPTPGETEITGAGGFRLMSPASHIVITGFKFTHASDKAKMEPGTTFCRWTRNIF